MPASNEQDCRPPGRPGCVQSYKNEVLGYDDAYRTLSSKVTIPTSETGLGGTYKTTSTYNLDGTPHQTVLPAGGQIGSGGLPSETLLYDYDELGNPTTLHGLTWYVTNTSYSKLGQKLQQTYSTGGKRVQETNYYEQGTNRLTRTTTQREVSPTPVGGLNYTYNDIGDVKRIADTPTGQTPDVQCFAHDHLQRLTDAWTPSADNCSTTPTASKGEEHQRRSAAISDALDAIDRTELSNSCERAAELIDEFAGDGEADLISRFADRLPPLVLVELFGVPDSDVPDMVQDVQNVAGSDENAIPAHQRLQATMRRLAESRKVRPGPDITSRLLEHPANYTIDDLVNDLLIMMTAAHLPTSGWIGNGLRLMLIDEQFAMALQGGRGSVAQALNQVLWEDSPSQNNIGRFAVHSCELAGRRVRPGDMLILGWAAANADPQVQPPAHVADAGVGNNRAHLSFGHGDHGCPFPAPELAEVIARTAVEVLLDRLPDIELAVKSDELMWLPSFWVRRLAALPVRFSPVMAPNRGG